MPAPVRLVLVGPPGSGKGTQGPVIADRLAVPYLSTGDLLRAEVDAGTGLGRQVAAILDRGDLVPDDLMMRVVATRLAPGDAGPDHAGPGHAGSGHAGPDHAGPGHAGPDHAGPGHAGSGHAGSAGMAGRSDAHGYVLDGFPRTLEQAQLVEEGASPLPPPELAVLIAVPEAVVHRRLAQRAAEGRADDADPAVIDRRLALYAEESGPLLAHYRRRGILVAVDGDQAPGAVTADIIAAIEAHPRPR